MNTCRLCGKDDLDSLLNLGDQPIAHDFLDNPEDEKFVHPVDIRFCNSCGLIQLVNPIPKEILYKDYIVLSAWKNQPHVPMLVEIIKNLEGLEKSSQIIEVGSNDGSFLKVLMEEGYSKAVGVEPAQDAREAAQKKGVHTIDAFLNETTAKELVAEYGQCDLLISRQMLEHVQQLDEFQKAVSVLVRPGGYVLIEVPDFDFCLSTSDYSGIWEEHVNYFTPDTLGLILDKAGVKLIKSETTIFSGQALIVLGKKEQFDTHIKPEDYIERVRNKALAFRDRWPTFCGDIKDYLKRHRENGGKVAVYGAGCRATSLVNFSGIGEYIDFILDDQPEKQGKYLPGSRLPIYPGGDLEKRGVDLCLLAVNAENEDKVIAKHKAYQEKGGRFVSILPPSKHLPPFWSSL